MIEVLIACFWYHQTKVPVALFSSFVVNKTFAYTDVGKCCPKMSDISINIYSIVSFNFP